MMPAYVGCLPCQLGSFLLRVQLGSRAAEARLGTRDSRLVECLQVAIIRVTDLDDESLDGIRRVVLVGHDALKDTTLWSNPRSSRAGCRRGCRRHDGRRQRRRRCSCRHLIVIATMSRHGAAVERLAMLNRNDPAYVCSRIQNPVSATQTGCLWRLGRRDTLSSRRSRFTVVDLDASSEWCHLVGGNCLHMNPFNYPGISASLGSLFSL
jgi:hypothetical protein